jgi:arginine-tRNA-protein transferase
VDEFQPKRNQRRCWRRNLSRIQVRERKPVLDKEHYRLYQRYTGIRHPYGGMADADERRYLDFLTTSWGDTRFYEFRYEGHLMGVAITDRVPDGLSAVYTFFDPDLASLSPGVFSILWQVAETRRQGLRWLYLGYWIGECDKMRYKDQYRPLEAWDGRLWQRFTAGQALDFAR